MRRSMEREVGAVLSIEKTSHAVKTAEVDNWNYFKDIPEVALDDFKEKVDAWILVYAEKFASI